MNAFLELSAFRQSNGFGPCPISRSEVVAYAVEAGLTDEQREDLIYHVRCLDRVFVEYHSRRNEG